MGGPGSGKPRDLGREREIVLARRHGWTYAEIGERHGICRERVRQILTRHAEERLWDADLVGTDAPVHVESRAASLKRRTRRCATCGEEFVVRFASLRKKHCGPECRARGSRWGRRWSEVEEMRQAGVTWREIGEKYGVSTQAAFTMIAALAARNGLSTERMRDPKGRWRRDAGAVG